MELLVNTVVIYKAGKQIKTVGPGKIDVPDAVGKDLLQRKCAQEPGKAETPSLPPASNQTDSGSGGKADDKKVFTTEQVIEAIMDLDPDKTELWNDDGKPSVVAVESVLEGNITEEQRDEAWAEIKKTAE